jgi:voltage-gated potassium channel
VRKRLTLLAVVAGVSLIVASVLFWLFEKNHNPDVKNLFDVLWWWVVTSGTVGYGDIVPFTWQGRLVAIFAILTGFFVFANLVALIAESVHAYLERMSRGTAQVTSRKHILICEYTAIADELIQSLPNCPPLEGRDVVIISTLVSQNPYPQHLFVNGVPINPAVLRQANVEHAEYVFIFANFRFADPDVKTLHVASRVRKLNPEAKILIEIVDPNYDLLKYAPKGVTVMNSRDLIETVLTEKSIDPSVWFNDEAKTDQ